MRRDYKFYAVVSMLGVCLPHLAVGADAAGPIVVPHAGLPALRSEHASLLELVKLTAVTRTAVRDGVWSNPQTWKEGRLPAADANVLIPEGMTVTFDSVQSAVIGTVRVDGKDTACSYVYTVTDAETSDVLGTAQSPIAGRIIRAYYNAGSQGIAQMIGTTCYLYSVNETIEQNNCT